MLSRLRIATRLWLPIGLLTINVLAIAAIGADALWNNLMNERMAKVKAITDIGLSTLQHFAQLEKDGTLTRDQAQQAARAALRSMHYETTEYLFVSDNTGTLLAHGGNSQLEGSSLLATKDEQGRPVFEALLKSASHGGGFVTYDWPKLPGETPSEKIAYSGLFTPWQWMVGTGLYVDDVRAVFSKKLMHFAEVSLILILAAGVVAVVIARSITRPLATLTRTMGRVANGDLDIAIDGTDRHDELGDMARALEIFRTTAAERQRLERLHAEQEARQDALRRQAVLDMADHFESQVGSIVHLLGDTAHAMQGMAQELESSTETADALCSTINSASAEASTSVEAVAGASEELAASMSEIARRLGEANQIAGRAVSNADSANEMVNDLNSSAERIGRVVGLITAIASQTNLLALNATIEAARAGEAGKGFAVVANEVKTLANQTARATDEISQQITSVQQQTRGAVQAIQDITAIIRRIDTIATSIASAVEEHGAATQEIARNVAEAARGTVDVSRGVSGVGQAVETADRAAHDVARSASEVASIATQLRSEVATLLAQVRA